MSLVKVNWSFFVFSKSVSGEMQLLVDLVLMSFSNQNWTFRPKQHLTRPIQIEFIQTINTRSDLFNDISECTKSTNNKHLLTLLFFIELSVCKSSYSSYPKPIEWQSKEQSPAAQWNDKHNLKWAALLQMKKKVDWYEKFQQLHGL